MFFLSAILTLGFEVVSCLRNASPIAAPPVPVDEDDDDVDEDDDDDEEEGKTSLCP